MLTMPKCHDCGKFCRPVEWQMIYSGALPEPQEEIYKCAACVEKHGSFAPQPGIKPECSCGKLPTTGATFPDGMTEEDDKEFNRQWNVERMTHNVELSGPTAALSPEGPAQRKSQRRRHGVRWTAGLAVFGGNMQKEVIGDATLYLGDCLDVLPLMTKGDADLLLTDPPYGVEFVGRAGVHEMLHNDHKGFDVAPYIDAALKVLRRGRHVYVFGPLEVAKHALCSEIELIWDKEMFGLGNLEIPWGPQHERITFAIHEISKANRDKGFGALAARLRRGSVLRSLRPNSGRAKNHPTEKPLDILAQMIESSTTMGETVLDPFMGSGSTIVAAVLERRRAIGIEIDPKHFATACRRVEEAQKQDWMFAAPEVGADSTAVAPTDRSLAIAAGFGASAHDR